MEEKSMRDMFRLGFGEEVANCVTHGIMAFLCICSLPAAVVYPYNRSGSELVAGVSVFVLCPFLMFLVSALYHRMPSDTMRRHVFHKLDHICIYFTIAGSYIPIVLTLTGGWQGYLILAIEQSVVFGGVLSKAISPKSYPKLSMVIYMTMGWTAIFFLPTLLSEVSPLSLVLTVGGGVMYTTSAFFYGKPQKKYFHPVWHVRISLASVPHFIAIVLVM